MRALFIICLIGFGVWAHTTGKLESWITQIELGNKPINDVKCSQLASVAKGVAMKNVFGANYQVIKISKLKQVSRSTTQLTCQGGALLDSGREVRLTMKVKDVGGERFYEFSSN